MAITYAGQLLEKIYHKRDAYGRVQVSELSPDEIEELHLLEQERLMEYRDNAYRVTRYGDEVLDYIREAS